MLMCSLS